MSAPQTSPTSKLPPRVDNADSSLLPSVVAMAVMVLASYGAFKWYQVRQWEQSRGEAIPAEAVILPLTEFELTERSGQPFRTADMKGKVWVATYFFTTCPGNCLRLNQNIKFMHDMPELEDVTWLSITCDPDNDSVEALAEYADRWEADPERWLFARADLNYTKQVAAGMKVSLVRKGHQDFAIVVDKSGKIRGMYDATSKSQCERLHAKLLECLEEEPPAKDAEAKADAAPAEDKSTSEPAAEKSAAPTEAEKEPAA
jgi:cytochrome oxidase Cu insertion factor (SCO1/SenC/PrrC family)